VFALIHLKVNRLPSIAVIAIRDINDGEEFTFDYRWSSDDFPNTRCFCGNKKECRGWLGSTCNKDNPTEDAVSDGSKTAVHTFVPEETATNDFSNDLPSNDRVSFDVALNYGDDPFISALASITTLLFHSMKYNLVPITIVEGNVIWCCSFVE
jgi:hypothetical protein